MFPDTIGAYLTIDETSLSQGELYTVITNKAARGKKGCPVAIIRGTDSDRVGSILLRKIPLARRREVKEVTLDMAASMEQIVRKVFTKATLVTDRFNVQKLAYEAVQQLRIEYRWQAIEQENLEMEQSKEVGMLFVPNRLEMGIPINNFWPEADTCFSRTKRSGCHPKYGELNCYSSTIPCWKKFIIWRKTWDISITLSKRKGLHLPD